MKNIQVNSFWSWNEFGFCFKIARVPDHPDYWYQIDMHFLFFDCWINFNSKI